MTREQEQSVLDLYKEHMSKVEYYEGQLDLPVDQMEMDYDKCRNCLVYSLGKVGIIKEMLDIFGYGISHDGQKEYIYKRRGD